MISFVRGLNKSTSNLANNVFALLVFGVCPC